MARETEIQRLVINAIQALDKLVVYRDEHPEAEDWHDDIQHAFSQAEQADSALSNILSSI